MFCVFFSCKPKWIQAGKALGSMYVVLLNLKIMLKLDSVISLVRTEISALGYGGLQLRN